MPRSLKHRRGNSTVLLLPELLYDFVIDPMISHNQQNNMNQHDTKETNVPKILTTDTEDVEALEDLCFISQTDDDDLFIFPEQSMPHLVPNPPVTPTVPEIEKPSCNSFSCQHCRKEYKSKQGLQRHKKKCKSAPRSCDDGQASSDVDCTRLEASTSDTPSPMQRKQIQAYQLNKKLDIKQACTHTPLNFRFIFTFIIKRGHQ